METLTEKIALCTSIVIMLVAVIFIQVMGEKVIGYPILLAGSLLLYLVETAVARRLVLVVVTVALLGLLPLTGLSQPLASWLTVVCIVLAIAVPLAIVGWWYKSASVRQYLLFQSDGMPLLMWRGVIIAVLGYTLYVILQLA